MTDNIIKQLVEYWENMQPWLDEDSIPDIPKVDKYVYDNHILPSIIRCGGIPKCKLSVGTVYRGSCRNSDKAIWDGNQFIYVRYKFNTRYIDKINHFEDDNGYDLFIPLSIVYDIYDIEYYKTLLNKKTTDEI
ncbi:MAG: hypothetical protein J6D03_07230 [Clostridia bacterium]|nr:hypothetical protein [Clostridia bacterium]